MTLRILGAAGAATLLMAGLAQAATIGVALSGSTIGGSPVANPAVPLSGAEQAERNATVAAANSAEVGLGATNPNAISYFIPLTNGTNCFFGVGSCGLVSDTGQGGGTMSMWVKYASVAGGLSFLNTVFGDLDLIGVNDPVGFFESVQVFDKDGNALTSLIDSASDAGVDAADATTQQGVAINLGTLNANTDYFARFQFKTTFRRETASNTPEHLVTWISSTPIVTTVPLPAAAWMLISGIGGLFAVSRRRSRVS